MENVAQQNDMVVDDEAVLPYPPRYWWLKRISIASGIFILLLIILRLWWGYEANRRLQVEIDKYRAAGQLVYAHEFDAQLDAVEDSENAAILLEQALSQIVLKSSSGVNYDDYYTLPDYFESHIPAAKELMLKNAGVFDLVKQAREKPKIAMSDWQNNVLTNLRSLRSYRRNLTNLLHFASNYYFTTGDHANAFSTLEDLHFLSNSIEKHPTIISILVAWSCHRFSYSIIEEHGHKLQIDTLSSSPQGNIIPTNRKTVIHFIHKLLDEEHCNKTITNAIRRDRSLYLDDLPLDVDSGKFTGVSRYLKQPNILTKPIFVTEIIRLIQYYSLTANAASQENWQEAQSYYPLSYDDPKFPISIDDPTVIRLIARPIYYTLFSSTYDSKRRFIESHYKMTAHRRMTAVALAIRLYEIDHGSRPEQLSQLEPDYLSSIPLDPFSETNHFFKYKPHAQNPALYSVGPDGKDDGYTLLNDDNNNNVRNRLDIPFLLDGIP